jgi:hypothetical protein
MHVCVCVCVCASSRITPFSSWSSGNLINYPAWSDSFGNGMPCKADIPLPDFNWTWKGKWEIDYTVGRDSSDPASSRATQQQVDADGWQYAISWGLAWQPHASPATFVRRRRWVCTRVLKSREEKSESLHRSNNEASAELDTLMDEFEVLNTTTSPRATILSTDESDSDAKILHLSTLLEELTPTTSTFDGDTSESLASFASFAPPAPLPDTADDSSTTTTSTAIRTTTKDRDDDDDNNNSTGTGTLANDDEMLLELLAQQERFRRQEELNNQVLEREYEEKKRQREAEQLAKQESWKRNQEELRIKLQQEEQRLQIIQQLQVQHAQQQEQLEQIEHQHQSEEQQPEQQQPEQQQPEQQQQQDATEQLQLQPPSDESNPTASSSATPSVTTTASNESSETEQEPDDATAQGQDCIPSTSTPSSSGVVQASPMPLVRKDANALLAELPVRATAIIDDDSDDDAAATTAPTQDNDDQSEAPPTEPPKPIAFSFESSAADDEVEAMFEALSDEDEDDE